MEIYAFISTTGGILFVFGLLLTLVLDRFNFDSFRTILVVFVVITFLETIGILLTDVPNKTIAYAFIYNFGGELVITALFGPRQPVIRRFAIGYLFAWPISIVVMDYLMIYPNGILLFGMYVVGVALLGYGIGDVILQDARGPRVTLPT